MQQYLNKRMLEMKILITGATGFVGSRLIESLFLMGHANIRILTRNRLSALNHIPFPVEVYEWDPDTSLIEDGALVGVNAVIHLAGESVAEGRWTAEKKEKILSSRLKSTQLLIETIKQQQYPPQKFISASAIGIYGDRGEESLNGDSANGKGFLADVCKQWEELSLYHGISAMNSHVLRVGIVLGENGGALKKMLPPFKAGVGGKLGSGDQYMSWIHIDDLVGQFIFMLENKMQHKEYNGVSPRPVSNYIFTKILGRELNRPTLFPVPAIGLKILFGEMSKILLASQKVIPTRLMQEGYAWKFRSLKDALRDILIHDNKGEEVIKKYQWVFKAPKEVFSFFSNEKNLEKITPAYMNFKVLGKNTSKIQQGTLIDYKFKIHGFPLTWTSKINSFQDEKQFIDEQVSGPYQKWVHTHNFYEVKSGTLIKDEIVYKVPFGFFGKLIAGSFVKKDLRNIFNFRHKYINQYFNL